MAILNRYSIVQRLIALLGIAAIGTALMVAFMMFILRGVFVDEEKHKLDAVLDSAISVISYYHSLQEQGELTETEAKQRAFARLNEIRYEGEEYIFSPSTVAVTWCNIRLLSSLLGQMYSITKIPTVRGYFNKWWTG